MNVAQNSYRVSPVNNAEHVPLRVNEDGSNGQSNEEWDGNDGDNKKFKPPVTRIVNLRALCLRACGPMLKCISLMIRVVEAGLTDICKRKNKHFVGKSR